MTDVASVRRNSRCLEIGTGSGYQAAVLRALGAEVFSIEYLPEVAEYAATHLQRAKVEGVHLRVGDGFQGWPEAAPFDAILITAAVRQVPRTLLAQLAIGGRLVAPVASRVEHQVLELWERHSRDDGLGAFSRRQVCDVRFVPFLGSSEAALSAEAPTQ
jgi:protein-L-isoaspartate(D-aspartate) O-methyltransferase